MPPRSVVFDVVGTCFGYDAGSEALKSRLGEKLATGGIPYKLLFAAWLSSAERDYAYLSTMKKYATYESILKQTFYRVLYQAGISSPETFATQDDIDFLVASYRKLKPRPGMPEMFQDLRQAGFEVYCCTDASPDRVKGYFDQAGVDMPAERILSADEVGVGKPDQPVYAMARQKVGADLEGAITVFAAAHAWDCCAARAVGFDTAYCTIYEKDPCEGVFGAADVVADDLPGLTKAIIARWGKMD